MPTEQLLCRCLSSKSVYFRFFDPSDSTLFDFSDDTWKATPTNPKLVATEQTSQTGDADESVYVASIDTNDLYSGSGKKSLLVQAVEDATPDVIISEVSLEILGGGAISALPSADAVKLEAVNEMLEAIGEYPVDALDTGGVSMAADAERVLDREDRRIQGDGWYENTEEEAELTPDVNDKVAITGTVLSIDTRDESDDLHVGVRDGYLYDLDDLTDKFDETTIYATIIRQIAFSNLSPALRAFVTAQAKLVFHKNHVNDPKRITTLYDERDMARGKARKKDAANADYSILRTQMGYQILGARGVPQPGR